MTIKVDVIVIGAGPGGYYAAELAGARGLKTLLVENEQLGGLYLNAGCIPTKSLLESAKLYDTIKHAESFGVMFDPPAQFSLPHAQTRKAQLISQMRDTINRQMVKHGIEIVKGTASFVDRITLDINDGYYSADHVVIATGSRLIQPEIRGSDQPHVLNTSQALDLTTLPESLAIIGGGPITLTIANIFSLLDTKVSVITTELSILPEVDAEIREALKTELTNVDFYEGTKIDSIGTDVVNIVKNDTPISLPAEKVLIYQGRQPNLDDLDLDNIDLDYDTKGIRVDDQMRTNLPGIYAIGDVTGHSQSAHSASRMAEVVVNTIIGKPDAMRWDTTPTIVYTYPEIASIGLTEAQAITQNIPVNIARLPMKSNERFNTTYEGRRAMCKVIVHAHTNVILGVHLMGVNASEMIFGANALIEDEFRVQDVKDLTFPQSTLSELLKNTLQQLQ